MPFGMENCGYSEKNLVEKVPSKRYPKLGSYEFLI